MDKTKLIKQSRTVREALTLVKESAWADVRTKAKRLKDEGRVVLNANERNIIEGTVEGDHGVYGIIIYRENPNNNKITNWHCDCAWGKYAWGRTRKYKKFEGRTCSHVIAAYWQSLTTPLTSEPEQQRLFNPPPPTPMPNYEVIEQPVPEQVPEPVETQEQPMQLAFPGMENVNTPQPGIRTTKWKRI